MIVVCLPGLEAVLAGELDDLSIAHRPAGAGALAARMTDRQLYLANVSLGTATRLLVDAGSFRARSFAALEHELAAVDLGRWLDRGTPVRFRITSHRSKLLHTAAVEERLRRVLGVGPAGPSPDDGLLVVVRSDRDVVSLRVDSSGAPLHRRGWRGPQAKAPLRETVARAALVASGWRPGRPLIDPMCGSGTIGIEAARWAAGILPGSGRSFAFEDWPSFAPGTWASVRASVAPGPPASGRPESAGPPGSADAGGSGEPSGSVPPVGSAGSGGTASIVLRDRDAGAVAAAGENAERAGVAHLVQVTEGSVSDVAPPAGEVPGLLLTNPPWGERVAGGGDLRDLYARLGQVAVDRLPGWTVAVLTTQARLAAATGLRPFPAALTVRAGAHRASLYVATVAP